MSDFKVKWPVNYVYANVASSLSGTYNYLASAYIFELDSYVNSYPYSTLTPIRFQFYFMGVMSINSSQIGKTIYINTNGFRFGSGWNRSQTHYAVPDGSNKIFFYKVGGSVGPTPTPTLTKTPVPTPNVTPTVTPTKPAIGPAVIYGNCPGVPGFDKVPFYRRDPGTRDPQGYVINDYYYDNNLPVLAQPVPSWSYGSGATYMYVKTITAGSSVFFNVLARVINSSGTSIQDSLAFTSLSSHFYLHPAAYRLPVASTTVNDHVTFTGTSIVGLNKSGYFSLSSSSVSITPTPTVTRSGTPLPTPTVTPTKALLWNSVGKRPYGLKLDTANADAYTFSQTFPYHNFYTLSGAGDAPDLLDTPTAGYQWYLQDANIVNVNRVVYGTYPYTTTSNMFYSFFKIGRLRVIPQLGGDRIYLAPNGESKPTHSALINFSFGTLTFFPISGAI